MADIPDTEYITVKRDKNGAVGIFVGGKPATHYRGVNIYDINYVKDTFADMQKENPNIMEWHVMSSETRGKFPKVGNPSSEHGRYIWCRVKNNDGQFGGWVFAYASAGAADFARYCAETCAYYVRASAAFRRAVLVTAFFDNGLLSNIDWSRLVGRHNVGPYRIIVEKVGPNIK